MLNVTRACVNVFQDFGDTIPGHGGFMDRFDCQLLMGTFVHVYNSSFVRYDNVIFYSAAADKPPSRHQLLTYRLQSLLFLRRRQ